MGKLIWVVVRVSAIITEVLEEVLELEFKRCVSVVGIDVRKNPTELQGCLIEYQSKSAFRSSPTRSHPRDALMRTEVNFGANQCLLAQDGTHY